MKELLDILSGQFGSELPQSAAPAFRIYYEFLEEKNKVMNLTAISGEEDVYTLHFADSLAPARYFDFNDKTAIDIGSGAGFPGLPIKIAVPSMKLTMLDALNKRIGFLQELCKKTGCADTQCIHARAEEAALTKEYRDTFDFALSRAVAQLNVLTELCLPFVKPGGYFIALKSVNTEEEIEAAKPAIKKLGGKIEQVVDYTLPGTDMQHRLVCIRKLDPTPKGYPRRFAKIQKTPIV